MQDGASVTVAFWHALSLGRLCERYHRAITAILYPATLQKHGGRKKALVSQPSILQNVHLESLSPALEGPSCLCFQSLECHLLGEIG
jgi:hypothetical protein